ncbi:winged helix-turn-helix domain-containing protein [Luteimicrobium subarcticum]|uniref:Putative transcriptional regulator n=1 Tax=Luteimicrobium subarcticum TaxID=620910 RepID=A0A2M8WRH7_9MICO|nr:helix-turn-helix domain-containing protein [Luteimicrobium subarcticum]PJI93541.1 putative transcriptional regulator [Luteimicrobium subarcticum]
MTDDTERTTPAQVAALGHPMRSRIWREVGSEGATVSQLANRLVTNKGNVAHHVKVLVAAGLLAPGRTRTVRGGTEQYYVTVASRLVLDDRATDATLALLGSVAEEIAAAREPLLNHRTIRLTRRQADALVRHLDRVITELEPAGEREASYGVLVSVYAR